MDEEEEGNVREGEVEKDVGFGDIPAIDGPITGDETAINAETSVNEAPEPKKKAKKPAKSQEEEPKGYKKDIERILKLIDKVFEEGTNEPAYNSNRQEAIRSLKMAATFLKMI